MADIILNLTIPDAYRVRVYAALKSYENETMRLITTKTPQRNMLKWELAIPAQGEDTPKGFVENILKKILVACVRSYEYGIDKQRYDTEVAALAEPAQTVPEGIIL